MSNRYFLDHENLIFQKEQLSFKQRVKVILNYIISAGVIALIVWSFFFGGIIESPEKYFLQKVNDKLVSEVISVNTKFDNISAQLTNVQKRDDNFYRVISEISPIPASVRQAGFGGTNKYNYLNGFENSDLLIESVKKGDILLNQLSIQSKSFDTIIYFAKNKQDSLLSVPGILPIVPGEFRVSDLFGQRVHPISGQVHAHTGIDFAANIGKDIYSTGNGVVVDVVKSYSGYGNHVIISHGYGFKTLYAHMSKMYVNVGDNITRGQIVGEVGNTGSSTGPHLHYEVIYDNIKRNPKFFYVDDLSDSEFNEMIKLLTVGN